MARYNKKPRIQRGPYEVRMHPGGGFTAFGQGMREEGSFCPSDAKLIERARQELMGRDGKAFSNSLKHWLGLRGILVCGKRSTPVGKETLGIEGPFRITKRGRVLYAPVPDKEIEKAIREFWSEEELEAAKRGEEGIRKVSDFESRFSREYRAALKRPGKFKGYVERVYPGSYGLIKPQIMAGEIDVKEVREELLERDIQGLPSSEVALRKGNNSERILYKQIRSLSKHPNLLRGQGELILDKRKMKFREVIELLVGHKKVKSYNKDLGYLSEEMVHFYLRWARLMGHTLRDFSQGEIHRPGGKRKFFYGDGKEGITDLRIGNQPIEVKSGFGEFAKKDLREVVNMYPPDTNNWEDGCPMEGGIVIFHALPGFYSGSLVPLNEAGIKVRTYEWFTERLNALVPEIKRHYGKAIREVRPRIGDLDYILSLNEERVLRPGFLARESNSERRIWSLSVLRSLAKKAKELQDVA